VAKRLFIMYGTAFSGKTTLAKRLVCEPGCAHVSPDEINAERGMFGGEGLLAQEWEHTHQIAQERMKQLMLKAETSFSMTRTASVGCAIVQEVSS
jgi:predicted kinase